MIIENKKASFINSKTIISAGILLLFLAASCGTVIHGSKQDIQIKTDPPGATIVVDGKEYNKTPVNIRLKRNKTHLVILKKEEYKTARVNFSQDFNVLPTIFGNILWLTPGVLVDVLAGGAWTLSPEAVNIALEEEEDLVK